MVAQQQIDMRCPICNTVQPAHVTRVDRGCAEWECSGCGGRWVVKDDRPGETFAFWPGDVEAIFSDDVLPFFEETESP